MTDRQKITHLLNRAGFGPKPGDIDRVRKMGAEQYVDQQLRSERVDDIASEEKLLPFKTLRMSLDEIFTIQPPRPLLSELAAQKIIRAVYSNRQLHEVMTDFWYNHFNVFWGKGADRWLTTDFENNAIRPHAMTRFKDLLLATARSPAMLFYLDNYLSTARRSGVNENYARELMELHTMGVVGGFQQKDVQDVARAFTGWSIERPRRSGRFLFRPRMHDDGGKTILGHTIAAGGGIKDGERVIEILARHPSTARFIATKLVRRFVRDDPPATLVKEVATVFTETDGSIPNMLKAIFTSTEFYASETYLGKTKSPFELAVSAIRALNGHTDGSPQLVEMIARMGQPLYRYPAPTGFPDAAGHWMTDGNLIARLNFGIALAANRIPGTSVDIRPFGDFQSAAIHLGSQEFQKR